MEQRLGKARSKNSTRAVMKLTETVEGKLRFVSEPPLIVPVEELFGGAEGDALRGRMQELLDGYRDSLSDEYGVLFDDYSFEGMARKVVGVGSVGTRAWVLLMVGRDDGDPLVLQAKEAQASVLEPYAGASAYANSGQRVVEGQRLMQAAGDIFLGWLPATGIDEVKRDFYVRQLWDGKLSVEVEALGLQASARLWRGMRLDARSRARALRGSHRDRRLPRQRRRVRPGDRRVLRGLRRPERTRSCRSAGGDRVRASLCA